MVHSRNFNFGLLSYYTKHKCFAHYLALPDVINNAPPFIVALAIRRPVIAFLFIPCNTIPS